MQVKNKTLKISLLIIFFISSWLNSRSSNVFSSSKDCITTPCTITGTGSFSIATNQLVRWNATVTGTPTQGHSFYLSHAGPNMTDIPISTSLADGFNQGTVFLTAGIYFIAINTSAMGPGSYSITYNLEASINIAPTLFDFGNVLEGTSSPSHTFSISLSGDMLPVNNISITNPDATHFQITSAPGSSAPTSFQVRYNAGTTAGPFGTTLTIHGTNPDGFTVADKTVTLTGTTIPSVPDISCNGSNCAGAPLLATVDGDVGATINFNKSFDNDGTRQLNITSIVLLQNEGGVFSLNGAPGLAPVPAGGSRNVSIHFAPPPGEHTYCGSIQITTNDPDEPVIECFFRARAHHPVPRMILENTDVDYHEVELGFSFTKPIIVRNEGDANLVINVNIVDPADIDIPQWSSIEEPNNITIAPGANRAFKEIFTPLALGTYSFQMSVSGNDLLNPSQQVTLHGSGTAPIPIDNVLVLDRSGSMDESAGTQRKIEALQKAANLYVDLLRPETGSGTGDKIGLVKYNNVNSDYLNLDFKNTTHYTNAQNALNDAAIADIGKLKPDNATGIGGAMDRAANMLVGSPDTRKQIMVVMTDGKENRTPWVSDVLNPIRNANPDLQIYSLGLGNDIDGALLQSITNVGNGYHQVSADLLGNNIFALEEFYFKIYSNATGANLIVDPTSAINLSGGAPVIVNTAKVVSSDRYATFLVLDDPNLRLYYKLELVDPSGQVMDLGSTVAGIPIQVMKRLNYTIYKVIFPDMSQAASYAGNWILRLNPTGKWNPKESRKRDSIYIQTQGEYIQPYQGLVPIGFGAAVRSDYNLEVTVTANNYHPGATVLLTAKLSDRGMPSSGTIHLTSTKPDGSTSNFILYDDGTHSDNTAGDGVYTNNYSQTALQGNYKFFFDATGINERGELVPRQATRYVGLFTTPPDGGGRPGDNKPCLPCWVNWLMLALLIAILVLIIRCCRKMLSR
jgi:hypothetical protein